VANKRVINRKLQALCRDDEPLATASHCADANMGYQTQAPSTKQPAEPTLDLEL
jgi:hypothetical protein